MTAPIPGLLGSAGPAQFEWLVHFCGRPNPAAVTPTVPLAIRNQQPWQRLFSILWEGQIRGFAPFGSDSPMVCLSESPLEHLRWLLSTRQWPPWGLLLRRQTVYDLGGGPVWYARPEQLEMLPAELRGWTVRFETGVNRSDWLHEREWRIPVPLANPVLPLPADAVPVILVGDPNWQPTALVSRTICVDDSGMQVQPGQLGHPQMVEMLELPHLWTAAERWYWDPDQQQILQIPR
ncbi:hypothetical protein [Actinoplanes couchii]|uniref:Uncharacterized protein n=1 Tax=Actinoplanes couchii TaxID=403638 RepID=A0ABQ3XLA5_9ACTN|nr:hypothetical protein [Actinoplanes couchii]MDR6318334.1 hypothetical protein [Actinoplanes couchii]GID59297.1 hypothetical protein Aco03nite_077010 [Actinoplanes couchii]